ncbi:Sulfhydrogenase 2 subunit alpha [uncultured archaeon]|nr:Sulfhydrogenase 2 subunit alpha [uncultured archaeon]
MHRDLDIHIDGVSKIEGHVDLNVTVRDGKVEDVKLAISENKRFFHQAIRGKSAALLPQMVSRICGTCSVAHLTACAEAVEHAWGIQLSEQSLIQRNLGMYGLMVRDHAMHLYIFTLPDLYGKDSILEFDGKLERFVHDSFAVKAAGNLLSRITVGRAVHGTIAQPGGYMKQPTAEECKNSAQELKAVRERVLDLIGVLGACDFRFERKSNFVGIVNDDYNFLTGHIHSTAGVCFDETHYWEHLNRVVIPYSQATAFEFEGREYMVGALARMNLNRDSLHKDTRRDVGEYLKRFPSMNIFDNNLAQAIETLHSIDAAVELLESTDFKQEKPPSLEPKAGEGVGVIEAPRGTLYYMLSINADGTVRWGNLVIPSAQNQIKLANDIRLFLPSVMDLPDDKIRFELEKMVRAYDPCMSCASHFLKLKWKGDGKPHIHRH